MDTMDIDFRECPTCGGYGVLDDGAHCVRCGGSAGSMGSGEIMIDRQTGRVVAVAELVERACRIRDEAQLMIFPNSGKAGA